MGPPILTHVVLIKPPLLTSESPANAGPSLPAAEAAGLPMH
jgi:hypothetical protein